MKLFRSIIVVLLLLTAADIYPSSSDYEILAKNIKAILWESNTDKIIPTKDLSKYYNLNGEYKDLDYKDNNMINWSAYHHMERLFRLTITYTHPRSKEQNNKFILDNIIKGLEYWDSAKPKSNNWWFNKIAVPEIVSEILILLNDEKQIKSQLKNNLASNIFFALNPYVGANRTQISINQFYIGIITKNPTLITYACNEVLATLDIGKEEGIQYDYSFYSSGNQLYTYGYGSSFLKSILDFSQYLKGSLFKLRGEKLDILDKFVFDGYLPIVRNDYIDYNATGRVISRKGALGSTDKQDILSSLAKINSDRKTLKKIQQYKDSNIYTNKYYWNSDYLIHSTPSIYFSVRGISNRTEQAEKGNNENLKGGNLSLGSTCIRTDGSEYYNIFSMWDWERVPGTTSTIGSTGVKGEWGVKGKTSFVGGITIPEYSLMTYAMNANQVKANKSYFCFNDIILCLGTNINSSLKKEVYTTINQCFLDKRLEIYSKQSKLKYNYFFDEKNNNINKIIHKDIIYYLPNTTNLGVKSEKRTGNWNDINASGNKTPESADIFSIVISHGIAPINASYSYIIAPFRATMDEEILNFSIVANDESLQAVLDKKNNILQIVFLQPSKLHISNATIGVNAPIIMIIRNLNQENTEFFVAEPTQQLKNVTITYNNKIQNVNLPSGTNAGTTIKIKNW